jgi:hypothetical protein
LCSKDHLLHERPTLSEVQRQYAQFANHRYLAKKREIAGPQQFKSNGYTRNGPAFVVDEASNDLSLREAITNDGVLPEQTEITEIE